MINERRNPQFKTSTENCGYETVKTNILSVKRNCDEESYKYIFYVFPPIVLATESFQSEKNAEYGQGNVAQRVDTVEKEVGVEKKVHRICYTWGRYGVGVESN